MRLLILTLSTRFAGAFLALSELALVLMMLAICGDVAMRAAFNHPIRGTYDAVGILLCASALFALAHVLITRHEVVIDLIDSIVSVRISDLLKRFWSAVTLVVIGYILWAMAQPMREARSYGDRSLELGLPLWLVWAMAMIGMAGALIAVFAVLMGPIRDHDAEHAALEESGE